MTATIYVPRAYSFVKEIMRPEKQYIREQKEAIAKENEIKMALYALANNVESSKINRKYCRVINLLTSANKIRRWF